MQALDNAHETCYNTKERMFWASVREGLLMVVRAIEDRWGFERSMSSKKDQGRRE